MSEEKDYGIDCAYTYWGDNSIIIKEPGEPEKKYDVSIGWNEPLVQIPLGYGVTAIATGIVADPKSEIGVKEGDLALRFGKIEKQVQTGTHLTDEMVEYSNKHPLAEIVMTKDFAKRLVGILTEYIEG